MTFKEYKNLRKGARITAKISSWHGVINGKTYRILSLRSGHYQDEVILLSPGGGNITLEGLLIMPYFERKYKFMSKGHVLQLIRGL